MMQKYHFDSPTIFPFVKRKLTWWLILGNQMNFKFVFLYMYLFYFVNSLTNFELFSPTYFVFLFTRTYFIVVFVSLMKWNFLKPCRFFWESYQKTPIRWNC